VISPALPPASVETRFPDRGRLPRSGGRGPPGPRDVPGDACRAARA